VIIKIAESYICGVDSRGKFLRYLYNNKIFSYPGVDFRKVCEEINLSVDEMQYDEIPYLEYNNFIDGPLGGKYFLTTWGIDEVERSMEQHTDVSRNKNLRYSFLRKLGDAGNRYTNINQIGKDLKIDSDTLDLIEHYLKTKGYVEGGGPMGPLLKITMAGRMILENGLPL